MAKMTQDDAMTVVPTLAIGIGMGGVSVIKEYVKFAENTNSLESCRFVAIDSNIDDLNKIIEFAPNTAKIEITDHQYDVENLRRNCPYLHDWVVTQKGGALQERVYGRFLLDLHRDEIKRVITSQISALADLWKNTEGGGEQKKHIVIWIVHSLGGGTGSGSFPALTVYIKKLASEILKGIIPHIYGVGILPSGTNITDISSATFTKRYLANSYAALEEIKTLAAADENNPVTLYPPFNSEPIEIREKPFEKYFLFGIDEELTTKLRKEKGTMVDDYLMHANKVIVNMMNILPQYPKGLENLWVTNTPFAAFGESELIVPITAVKRLASENDLLGMDIEEDAEKKEVLNKDVTVTMKSFIKNMSEQFLEDRFLSIFHSHRLIGLAYYGGKLQNQMNKYQIRVQNEYESKVDEWWEILADQPWSSERIAKSGSVTPDQKHQVIIQLLNERSEDLQRKLDSILVNPLKKPDLRERKDTINTARETLERLKLNAEKIWILKQYIDTRIGEKLPLPSIQNQEKPRGVGPIVEYTRKRDLYRKNTLMKRLQTGGSGRVISLTLTEEQMEALSNIHDLDVSHLETIPDYIDILKYSASDVDKVIKNRVEQARDRHLTVVFGSDGMISVTPQEEMFILCNKKNEELLGKNITFSSLKVVKIPSETFNIERIVFLDINLNLSIDDIKEYSQRKLEYNSGKLKEKTDITGPVGTIFAYPEWFVSDPEVRATFPRVLPEKKPANT